MSAANTKRENFYRRDPGAALAGMAGMSLEERGVYNTIIDLLYLTWRPVEDSRAYIAGHCGCAVQKLNPILGRLIASGKLIRFEDDGQFYISNGKFEAERASVKGVTTRSGRGEVGEKSAGVGEKSASVGKNPPTCKENVTEIQSVTALEKSRVEKTRQDTDDNSARARFSDIDRSTLTDLEKRLREAGGKGINAASPMLQVVAPILGLLRPGDGPACDLELDVIPAIMAASTKVRKPVDRWDYFVPMIREARDRRLQGAPAVGEVVANRSTGPPKSEFMDRFEADRAEARRRVLNG